MMILRLNLVMLIGCVNLWFIKASANNSAIMKKQQQQQQQQLKKKVDIARPLYPPDANCSASATIREFWCQPNSDCEKTLGCMVIGYINTTNIEKCCTACHVTAACRAWNFNRKTGKCWMRTRDSAGKTGQYCTAGTFPAPNITEVEVYKHGEEGFACLRIPATVAVNGGVLLSFAAARCFTGDSCYPYNPPHPPKNYSAHVVKRSVDGGRSWSPLIEIARTSHCVQGNKGGSPEGSVLYDHTTNTTIATFRLDTASNKTTGLKLWQAESTDAGMTWNKKHPFVVRDLTAADVTVGTHIAPGTGIQLSATHKLAPNRLLTVLILEDACRLDVVVYSDDGGRTWKMANNRLPGYGEAQLAVVDNGTIIFNGRHDKTRGVAFSDDGGVTWRDLHTVTDDLSTGVSCMSSLLTHPMNPSRVLYSHPTGPGRLDGIILSGNASSQDWNIETFVTPANASRGFAYSCMNDMTLTETSISSTAIMHTNLNTTSVGLTYETDDVGCKSGAPACRIMFQIVIVPNE